ncbi:MAG: hypothetical protein V7K18_04735 [Nostoc sp.]|uniref:hypothetical protein n=1 Tax=Nostoc sp. TaxID=1180 RepID=UPI002FFAC7F0
MINIKAGRKNLMNLSVTTSFTKTVPKLTYDVLIENEQDGRVSATVLECETCQILKVLV